jgi:hypothetical protein
MGIRGMRETEMGDCGTNSFTSRQLLALCQPVSQRFSSKVLDLRTRDCDFFRIIPRYGCLRFLDERII